MPSFGVVQQDDKCVTDRPFVFQTQSDKLESQCKSLRAKVGKLERKNKKSEEQKQQMHTVIDHLKHINRELMSALLSERATQEKAMTEEEFNNLSLIPQAVKLMKEGEEMQSHSGPDEEEEAETAREDTDPAGHDKEFYLNLKDKYRQAKENYRSLVQRGD